MTQSIDIMHVKNICNPGAGCHLGEYGQYHGCPICPRVEVCSDVKDAGMVSLQELPLYTTSCHPAVREAARIRFIELQEELLPKELPKHRLKSPRRFLRNLLPTSHKI